MVQVKSWHWNFGLFSLFRLFPDTIRAIELFTYFNIELGGFQKHVFAVFDEGERLKFSFSFMLNLGSIFRQFWRPELHGVCLLHVEPAHFSGRRPGHLGIPHEGPHWRHADTMWVLKSQEWYFRLCICSFPCHRQRCKRHHGDSAQAQGGGFSGSAGDLFVSAQELPWRDIHSGLLQVHRPEHLPRHAAAHPAAQAPQKRHWRAVLGQNGCWPKGKPRIRSETSSVYILYYVVVLLVQYSVTTRNGEVRINHYLYHTGQFNFIKKLQHQIKVKNDQFRNGKFLAEREKQRLARRGLGANGDTRDNVTRKESILLGEWCVCWVLCLVL